MNKGFVYISNEEIVVTDDNGNLITRKIDAVDMRNLLILENNIEKINGIITKVENDLEKAQEIKNSKTYKQNKKLLKLGFIINQLLVIVLTSIFSTFNLLNATITIFGGTINNFILNGMAFSILSSYEKANIKTINGLETELKKLNQLKEEYESKLEKTKTMIKDETLALKVQEELIASKQMISLEEHMELPVEIIEEINDAYDLGYNSQVKTLKKK